MANDRTNYADTSDTSFPNDTGVLSSSFVQYLLAGRDSILGAINAKLAKKYQGDRASSQIVGGSDEYDTRLQAEWSRGVRANGIFPQGLDEQPMYPWPINEYSESQAGLQSGDTGGGQDLYHDLLPQPMEQFYDHGVAKDRYRHTGLNDGPAPWKAPFLHQSGLGAMAGPGAFSSQQWQSGHEGGVVIAPPSARGRAGNTTRSLSDILGRVQGAAAAHLPAVFTPKEVQ